jgi:signal transduction histidine kinase
VRDDLLMDGLSYPSGFLRTVLATLRLHAGAEAACLWMESAGGIWLVEADPRDLPLGEVVPHPGGAVADVMEDGAIHLVESADDDPRMPSLPLLQDRLGSRAVVVLPARPVGTDPHAVVCLYFRDVPPAEYERFFAWGRWARLLEPFLPGRGVLESESTGWGGGLVDDRPENVRTMARKLARRMTVQLATIEASLTEAGRLVEDSDPAEKFMRHATETLDRTKEMLGRLELFAGEDAPAPAPVSLADCLRAALQRLEPERPARVRLIHRIPTGLPLVLADRVQLMGAVEEVVRNALEAAPAATDVLLRVELSGTWICVEVSDQGTGMTRELLERAALPFHTTKNRAGHTGLGLSTAEGIVRRYGGRIAISSSLGHGTTVRMWLPCEPASSP